MNNSIAIIGDTNENSDVINQISFQCQANGMQVKYPILSESLNNDVDARVISLNRIVSADFVYVYNPNGEVSTSTGLEVGACFAHRKPIFFCTEPDDLPIPVLPEQIKSHGEFIEYVHTHEPSLIANYGMCPEAEKAYQILLDYKALASSSTDTIDRNKTVAFIGSFRKYYGDVTRLIELYQRKGISTLSPANSEIVYSIGDFVILGTDKKHYTPAEIEMITLKNIVDAESIYVVDPGGYIGLTTAYEIGYCLCKRRPMYFLEKPETIPLPVIGGQIMKPELFAELASQYKPPYITKYPMGIEAKKAYRELIGISSEVTHTTGGVDKELDFEY